MEKLDRIYLMRAGIGALSGIISAFIISSAIPSPAYDQPAAIGIAVIVAIVMYIVSSMISRRIAPSVPKELKRKVATDGIIPFIFVQIVVMVIVYTAMHEPILSVASISVFNSGGEDVTGKSIGNHTILYVTSSVSPQNRAAAGAPFTGWVEYLRFYSTDCTGSSASLGNVTISDGVAPKSAELMANSTLSFESYYSGNSQYRGTLSGCGEINVLPASSK